MNKEDETFASTKSGSNQESSTLVYKVPCVAVNSFAASGISLRAVSESILSLHSYLFSSAALTGIYAPTSYKYFVLGERPLNTTEDTVPSQVVSSTDFPSSRKHRTLYFTESEYVVESQLDIHQLTVVCVPSELDSIIVIEGVAIVEPFTVLLAKDSPPL